MRTYRLGILGTILALIASLAGAQPFTYQGMLKQNGAPVNATLSMTFKLYDALTGGNPIGAPITQNVPVQNGLFTVQLNFGNVWTGGERYLEITVGSTTLSPRVRITAAPYASFAQRPWVTSGSSIFYTDGNVGVGTSNPSVRLSLGGDNANTKLAVWDGGASGVMGFGVGTNQFRLHLANSNGRFSFLNAPNGNELMTIYGNGRVWVGPPHGLMQNPLATLTTHGWLEVIGELSIIHPALNTQLRILPRQLFGSEQVGAVTLDIYGHTGTIGIWDSLSVLNDLHVGGSRFTLGGGTDTYWRRVEAGVSPSNDGLFFGYAHVNGPNGSMNALLTAMSGNHNHGSVAVLDGNATIKAMMFVGDDGRGVVAANVKNFRVPDPEDATRDIWYGCIEGPELAMYVRGTAQLVNGRARIELPDHFRKLADEQGMTVQLTPRSAESKGLAAVQVSLNGIEVVELLNGRGNYEFDWRVEAVRKEHRDFRVYRPWDEVMPAGTDPAQAWEARLKSIQDQQARQNQQASRSARKEDQR